MTILEFQSKYAEEILKILPTPKWMPILNDFNKKILDVSAQKHGRRAFASQMEFVVAPILYNFLEGKEKVGIINAEMGTGKTTMSNIVAYNLFKEKFEEKGMSILFLTSGAKHLKKMRREAEAVFGDNVKISFYIIKTNPRKKEKEEITLEEALEIKPQPGEVVYFLLSKDTGKFDIKYENISEKLKKCPDCGHKFEQNKKGKKNKIKTIFCPSCGTKLIKPVKGKLGYAEKIEKKARFKTHKFWDLAIVDEVHEFQNPLSLQSRLYKAVIKHSYYKIVMTGTLSNGYASSIFHILYPLIPNHFKKYGFDYKKIGAFIDYFGSKKESRTFKLIGKGGRQTVKIEELPRINDKIVGFLAPYTVWFEIKDLDVEMPPLKEFLEIVPMDPEIESAYKIFERRIKNVGNSMVLEPKNQVRSALASFVYRLNNHTYPHTFTMKGYGIQLTESGIVPDGNYQEIEVSFEPLPEDFISNKEKKLIEVVSKELAEGRRVIIYGVYNHATKLYDRLVNVLGMHGIDADYMPDNVKAEDIEEWINNYDKDVVILPQKRVATGLDLVQFHTIVFYELDRQLRIVSQAKQRPWRPVGQEKEVRVYYLAYEGLQEKELKLMAEKMRAAATVEGRIIEDDSIAAIYDYNPEVSEAIKEISDKIQYVDTEIVRSKDHNEFAEYYLQKMKEFDESVNIIETASEEEIQEETKELTEEKTSSSRIIETEKVSAKSEEKVLTLQSVMEDMNPPAETFEFNSDVSIPELVATLESVAQGNIPVELLNNNKKEKEKPEEKNEEDCHEINMAVDDKGQMYFVFD